MLVKCVHHIVGLYRSGITTARPLRVVYALDELVPIADRVAVAGGSKVAAEVDSVEGGGVGVDSCIWMSSEWLSLKEVCNKLGIGRRC